MLVRPRTRKFKQAHHEKMHVVYGVAFSVPFTIFAPSVVSPKRLGLTQFFSSD